MDRDNLVSFYFVKLFHRKYKTKTIQNKLLCFIYVAEVVGMHASLV